MEDILHAFGVDWRLIAIQIFNFTLMAALLTYFLYKPILKILQERQEKIKESIENAEQATKSLELANTKRDEILTEANNSAEEIAQNAKQYADAKRREMEEDARRNAQKVLEDAEIQAKEAKLRIIEESEAEVAKAAVLAAEKILREKST